MCGCKDERPGSAEAEVSEGHGEVTVSRHLEYQAGVGDCFLEEVTRPSLS